MSVVGSLEGRESKVLVGEYGFGASVLRWSSAEVSFLLGLILLGGVLMLG